MGQEFSADNRSITIFSPIVKQVNNFNNILLNLKDGEIKKENLQSALSDITSIDLDKIDKGSIININPEDIIEYCYFKAHNLSRYRTRDIHHYLDPDDYSIVFLYSDKYESGCGGGCDCGLFKIKYEYTHIIDKETKPKNISFSNWFLNKKIKELDNIVLSSKISWYNDYKCMLLAIHYNFLNKTNSEIKDESLDERFCIFDSFNYLYKFYNENSQIFVVLTIKFTEYTIPPLYIDRYHALNYYIAGGKSFEELYETFYKIYRGRDEGDKSYMILCVMSVKRR